MRLIEHLGISTWSYKLYFFLPKEFTHLNFIEKLRILSWTLLWPITFWPQWTFCVTTNIAEMENYYIKNCSLLEIKHVVLSRSSYKIYMINDHINCISSFPRNSHIWIIAKLRILSWTLLWPKTFGPQWTFCVTQTLQRWKIIILRIGLFLKSNMWCYPDLAMLKLLI